MYLQERGTLEATLPNASERLIRAYREHLDRVRGLAASTIARHAVVAGDFLRLLKYDDDPVTNIRAERVLGDVVDSVVLY
jgi:hypothetical protein